MKHMKRENILRIKHDLNKQNTECFEQLNPFETVYAKDFLKIQAIIKWNSFLVLMIFKIILLVSIKIKWIATHTVEYDGQCKRHRRKTITSIEFGYILICKLQTIEPIDSF